MYIKPIDTKQVHEFLHSDPNLCYLALPDSALDQLYHTGEWKISDAVGLLGVFNEEDKVVCFIRYEPYTTVSVYLHMYVTTVLHKTGAIRRIKEILREYLHKHNPELQRAFFMVPGCCEHVIGACKALGLTQEGELKDCLVWRQKLTDILIFAEYIYK